MLHGLASAESLTALATKRRQRMPAAADAIIICGKSDIHTERPATNSTMETTARVVALRKALRPTRPEYCV
jgi:hypothetical protein